jgi:hypothetical protein
MDVLVISIIQRKRYFATMESKIQPPGTAGRLEKLSFSDKNGLYR